MGEFLQVAETIAHLALCAVCARGYLLLERLADSIETGADRLHDAAETAERAAARLERASHHG